MKLKIVSIHLIFFFVGFIQIANSQDGTVISAQQIQYESNFSPSIFNVQNLKRTFHISVHVTAQDGSGTTGVSESYVRDVVNQLDTAFDVIGVGFEIRDFDTAFNYNFNTLSVLGNEQMLTSQHKVSNTINLFIVGSLTDRLGNGVNAYTYMPGDSLDYIFITKTKLNFYTLIEQFGHFFNLYNTDVNEAGLGGAELVNGSNCATSGDRCCDTPADPGLSGRVNGSSCNYTGGLKDAVGEFYIPVTRNYMSSAPVTCRCNFSNEQLIRMINCMQTSKKHLW